MHYLCIESCFQVNSPDAIFFYYHYEPYGHYWELARRRVTPVKVDLTDFLSHFHYGFRNRTCKKYSYAHHADFIRLEKLIDCGGIYADIDTLFVNTIPDHLFTKSFVLGREDDVICQTTGQKRASLCNAFIMSEKGSDFARLWHSQMQEAFNGSWSNHSTLLPQKLSEEHPDLIHIEPVVTFYKYMWTREDIRRLLEECEKNIDGVVSIHLWSHLWWSKKRRDFSDFHEGILTEEYVRTVDTTYNIIARNYLP